METLARIEKLVYGGDGLARVDGQAVFVPFTAPGDLVRIDIFERKKGFARGRVLEIVEPGTARRTAPCHYFGSCGGCQLQHIEYEGQLEVKAGFVAEALERIAKIRGPHSIRVQGRQESEFHYRIRCTAHVDPGGAFGFYSAESHSVVDIESCPLLAEPLDAKWREMRSSARDIVSNVPSRRGGLRDIHLAAGDETGAKDGTHSIRVGNHTYTFGSSSFFQVNAAMMAILVSTALDGIACESALELYSGVGLFTVPLASLAGRVIAVEVDAESTRFARKNLRDNGVRNVETVTMPVEKWLECPSVEARGVETVLLDPPRGGVGTAATRLLARLRASRVVYVSCDPSTLARDLRVLLDEGYQLDSVDAVDLFPQTYHVETIARLSRIS